MTIDFCKPWSDEECRLFLDAIKKRKTEYCEKRDLPVPAFDKVEDFYVEAGMMPGHEAAGSGETDMLRKEKNIPLTLEELREMDGEPVWVADLIVPSCSQYYFRQNVHGHKLLVEPKDYPSETLFVPHYNADDENGTYGRVWLAYRRKPEEGTT